MQILYFIFFCNVSPKIHEKYCPYTVPINTCNKYTPFSFLTSTILIYGAIPQTVSARLLENQQVSNSI